MDEAGRARAVGLTASRDDRPHLSPAGWLTDRRVSVALMAFVVIVGVVGAIVPQRVNTPPARFEEWRAQAGAWSDIALAVGLDRIFSAWWFVGVLALFALSLIVATARMVASAARRTRSRAAQGGGRGAQGWRALSRVWATPLLHLGLALGIVAAVASAAFSSRAVLDLSVGEVHEPGAWYLVEDGGPLSTSPDLGGPVRLDGVDTAAWESGELKSLAARVSVLRDGTWVAHASSANDPLRLDGHVVYVQPGEFGDAAFLEVRRAGELMSRLRMEFAYIPEGEVGYGDILLADGTSIDGRWDPSRTRGLERLALRPSGAGEEAVQALEVGETVEVGGYEVTLVDVRPWARLVVARPYFTGLLFAAFAIIALGSAARYLPGLLTRPLPPARDAT